MHIVQINKYVTINGGSEMVMSDMSAILKNNGNTVTNIGYTKNNQKLMPYAYVLGNESISLKDMFLKNDAINTIVAYIKKHGVPLVICHNIYHHYPMYPLLKKIKKETNATTILILHDYKIVCPVYSLLSHGKLCEKCKNRKYFHCIINRCKNYQLLSSIILAFESFYHNSILNVYRYIDCFISPSNFLAQKVYELGARRNFEILRNPVLVPIQQIETKEKKLNAILFVGRLSELKGIATLIKLSRSLKGVKVGIIGDGPLREYVEKNRSEQLIYYGYCNKKEIKEITQQYAFGILPSIGYENNPMSILESFCFGIPMLASNIGGMAELVGNDKGYLFNPFDFNSVLHTVERAIGTKKDTYHQMVKKCYDYSCNYTTDEYYKQLSIILKKYNVNLTSACPSQLSS